MTENCMLKCQSTGLEETKKYTKKANKSVKGFLSKIKNRKLQNTKLGQQHKPNDIR